MTLFGNIGSWIRVLLAVALLSAGGAAQAAPGEYEVKAQFIRHFASFVEWPAEVGVVRVCVLGRDPFGAALDELRGKPVKERRLEVTLLEPSSDIRECRILFVAPNAERYLERIATVTRGAGILIVGDTDGYALRGAMINFYPEGGKIRFEINLDAIRLSHLKVSARLLSLGRIVDNRMDR